MHAQDDIGRSLHKSDSAKVEAPKKTAHQDAEAAQMQGMWRDHDAQRLGVGATVVAAHEKHLTGGTNDTSLSATTDRLREADGACVGHEGFDKMLDRQAGSAAASNPIFDAAEEAQRFAVQQDTQGREAGRGADSAFAALSEGPSPAEAHRQGREGLSAATAFSAQEGSMKSLSKLNGLDEAISGLRAGMGKGGPSLSGDGGASLSAGMSGGALSPNHHSLRGAQNEGFMAARNEQRNQAFAAKGPTN